MRSIARRVRSKSPFRRRRQATELIEDICKVETEYKTHFQSTVDASAIEIILEPPVDPSLTTSVRKASKHSEIPDVKTMSTTSTEESTMNSPRMAVQKRKSFRDRFMNNNKSRDTPTNEKSSRGRGRSKSRRSRPSKHRSPTPDSPKHDLSDDDEDSVEDVGDNARCSSSLRPRILESMAEGERYSYKDSSKHQRSGRSGIVNSLIDVDRHETGVSELSTPLAVSHQRSMGEDSIANVRNALSQMEQELKVAEKSGKKVSRKYVLKALFSVADSLECPEERSTMHRQLSRLIENEEESLVSTSEPRKKASLARSTEVRGRYREGPEDFEERSAHRQATRNSHRRFDPDDSEEKRRSLRHRKEEGDDDGDEDSYSSFNKWITELEDDVSSESGSKTDFVNDIFSGFGTFFSSDVKKKKKDKQKNTTWMSGTGWGSDYDPQWANFDDTNHRKAKEKPTIDFDETEPASGSDDSQRSDDSPTEYKIPPPPKNRYQRSLWQRRPSPPPVKPSPSDGDAGFAPRKPSRRVASPDRLEETFSLSSIESDQYKKEDHETRRRSRDDIDIEKNTYKVNYVRTTSSDGTSSHYLVDEEQAVRRPRSNRRSKSAHSSRSRNRGR